MSFSSRSVLLAAAALTLPMTLAACGGGDDNDAELEQLDDSLTDLSDPAVNEALNDEILVDPELTDQSNRNAIKGANGAPSGAVPPTGYAGDAQAGKAGAAAEFARSGGGLLNAPEPRVMTEEEECSSCAGGANNGATLGARAEQQAARRGKGTCDQKLDYNMAWANRLPPEFKVYPKANVKEAAGVEGGLCDLRVVSFTTPVAMKNVVDYYYTKAKRAGYSSEYLLRSGEHVLGGVRDDDDGAYFITFARQGNGGTAVDIVASNGR